MKEFLKCASKVLVRNVDKPFLALVLCKMQYIYTKDTIFVLKTASTKLIKKEPHIIHLLFNLFFEEMLLNCAYQAMYSALQVL
jgi:hypothetical protein